SAVLLSSCHSVKERKAASSREIDCRGDWITIVFINPRNFQGACDMADIRNKPFGLDLTRRGFVQGSALLGLSLAAASFPTGRLLAREPKRGGHLKLGLGGGASADTLDPALASATVAFVIAHCWGDTLVESHPETGEPLPSLAESWSP